MNILYITPDFPYPKTSGGKIKSSATIDALTSLGHKLTLITFLKDEIEEKEIKSFNKKRGVSRIFTIKNVKSKKRNFTDKLIRFAVSALSTKPYGLTKYYSKKMGNIIQTCLKKDSCQVIWINNTHMAQYIPSDFPGLKILETLDVESKLYKEALFLSQNHQAKFFYLYEWIKYALCEKSMYKKFDLIFSISDKDAKLLRSRIENKKIFVLPPRIDIKNVKREKIKKNTLLYIGTLFWYPNRDGLTWFLEKVYPEIYRQIPQIKLRIIGPKLKNQKFIKQPGTKFLGLGLEDKIAKYINQSEIFVCPILYGSGIRTKILEAMSYGIPAVSTFKGAEGLKVEDGKEILLAKDSHEFAKKVSCLLKDRKLQKKLSENGKKYVRKFYNQGILKEKISKALSNL